MKFNTNAFYGALLILGLVTACGAVKNTADEITHGINVQGNWLMTQSEHSNQVEKALENESMVLTFKDGKAAFSPTDSIKGHAVFALLSQCTVGPRPYHMDKNQIVFEAVAGCDEKRSTFQTLNDTTLKLTDPDNADIVRTFARIDENKYEELVKASDRRL